MLGWAGCLLKSLSVTRQPDVCAAAPVHQLPLGSASLRHNPQWGSAGEVPAHWMALFFFTGLGRVFSQILLGSHLLGVSGRSTSVGTELQDLQQLVQLGTGSQAHWPRARQLPGTEPQYRGVISYLTLPSLPGTMVPLELPTTVSTCAQASLGFRTRASGGCVSGLGAL